LKQHTVGTVGLNFGHYVKEHHANGRGKGGLHKMPERPQQGLLVFGGEIAFYKQTNQVAVAPQLAQVLRGLAAGGDDDGFCFQFAVFNLQFAGRSGRPRLSLQYSVCNLQDVTPHQSKQKAPANCGRQAANCFIIRKGSCKLLTANW
jgi:hypothetical protein